MLGVEVDERTRAALHAACRCSIVALLPWSLLACAGDPPFLWQVQAAHSSPVVYLLGTYHFDAMGRDNLAPSVRSAFDRCSVFYAEADTRDVDLSALVKQARLPAGQLLNRLLSPTAWQQLVGVLDRVPPAQIATLRPWLVNAMLLASLQPADEAIDVTLLREAERAGKQIGFFETAEQQVALLNSIPLAEAVGQLERDMLDFERLRRDLDALLSAYRRGDAKAFLERDGYDPSSETFEIVIRQRNKTWLPDIASLLRGSEKAFVAVGLSHLVGPEGLIASLAAAGFQIRRLGYVDV